MQKGKSPKNDLSGKYSYASTRGNGDTFVREEFIPSLGNTKSVLLYRNGFWFITNEEYYIGQKKTNEIQGYLRLETKGKAKNYPLNSQAPYFAQHYDILSELNPLKLSTSWNVLGSQEGTTTAETIAQKRIYDNNSYTQKYKNVLATVKIFSNEEEYKNLVHEDSTKLLADFFNKLQKR